MPGNEVSAYEMNGNTERMELETRERTHKIGQQRDGVELAAGPTVSAGGRYA